MLHSQIISNPAQWLEWRFNGGKMQHIRVVDGKFDFGSLEAEEAFRQGKCTLKVHGECACLFRIDGEWKLFQRFDVGSKLGLDVTKTPEGCFALPQGTQASVYTEGGKPHHYFFKECDPKAKATIATLERVKAAADAGRFFSPSSADSPYFVTFEWIGKKHQANVDALPIEHAVHPHGSVQVDFPFEERTVATVVRLAKEMPIEGLVFQHPVSKALFKMRFDQCVPEGECAFDKIKKTKQPPAIQAYYL